MREHGEMETNQEDIMRVDEHGNDIVKILLEHLIPVVIEKLNSWDGNGTKTSANNTYRRGNNGFVNFNRRSYR